MSWHRSRQSDSARRRDDGGAAAVEFALVMVPLMLIVFGVISYGLLLSFRQSLSQAAAEGARAAAVASPTADRQAIAEAAVADVLGVACGSAHLTCTFPGPGDAGYPCTVAQPCVVVTLAYDYTDDPSTLVFPGSSVAIPDTLGYTAVSRISRTS